MVSAGLTKEQYFDYEFVADYFIGLWENSGDNRKAGLVVCKSALGLYHLHMACYGNTTTLKSVADILYHSHVEPQYGGKDALKSYLLKDGIYSEKGEIVLLQKNLDVIEDAQGKRSDLEEIARLLKEGQTPQQILRSNLQYYRYEKLILHAYTDMRIDTAPVKLDVYCEWHLGESGSGKTYFYNTLCDKYGKDKIYIVTDYDNNASGGFDGYMRIGCPPILFMDEFKGCGISYQKLLKEIFMQDEIPIIINYLKSNPDIYNLGILLTFQTGLRVGELSTLKKEDLHGHVIKIRRTEDKYRNENNKWVVTIKEHAKTDAGNRDLIIPSTALTTLNLILELNPSGTYLFEHYNKRIRGNTFNKRLSAICDKLQIPHRTMHKIRKTYGTTLIDGDVDEGFITEQMGHSDISTTKKLYYFSNKTMENKEKQIENAICF